MLTNVFSLFLGRYGFRVGQYPWYFIFGCLVFSGLCGIGLINYTEENNAFRLWIPKDSSFVKNYEWLQKNFPPDARYDNLILSGEDVLQPQVLQLLADIHRGVSEDLVAQPFNRTWRDLCKKCGQINEK